MATETLGHTGTAYKPHSLRSRLPWAPQHRGHEPLYLPTFIFIPTGTGLFPKLLATVFQTDCPNLPLDPKIYLVHRMASKSE